jgi:hypothetical protein
VIVIFYPLLTRSSKSDKCVLASNAPTNAILEAPFKLV